MVSYSPCFQRLVLLGNFCVTVSYQVPVIVSVIVTLLKTHLYRCTFDQQQLCNSVPDPFLCRALSLSFLLILVRCSRSVFIQLTENSVTVTVTVNVNHTDYWLYYLLHSCNTVVYLLLEIHSDMDNMVDVETPYVFVLMSTVLTWAKSKPVDPVRVCVDVHGVDMGQV